MSKIWRYPQRARVMYFGSLKMLNSNPEVLKIAEPEYQG